MDLLTQILDVVPDWLQALSLLIAGASAVAALTPTKKDDEFLLKVTKVIDFLALNIFNAKRKP